MRVIKSYKVFCHTIKNGFLYYGFKEPIKISNPQKAYKLYKIHYKYFDKNIPGDSYLRTKK